MRSMEFRKCIQCGQGTIRGLLCTKCYNESKRAEGCKGIDKFFEKR